MSHPTAWAWLVVYIVSPIGAVWVTVLEERRYRAEPGRRTARVGILGTLGVTTLQLLGALINNDHFDGPAGAVTVYLFYAALLGAVALWAWSPALMRREPASAH
jgi:hypothetical protein